MHALCAHTVQMYNCETNFWSLVQVMILTESGRLKKSKMCNETDRCKQYLSHKHLSENVSIYWSRSSLATLITDLLLTDRNTWIDKKNGAVNVNNDKNNENMVIPNADLNLDWNRTWNFMVHFEKISCSLIFFFFLNETKKSLWPSQQGLLHKPNENWILPTLRPTSQWFKFTDWHDGRSFIPRFLWQYYD